MKDKKEEEEEEEEAYQAENPKEQPRQKLGLKKRVKRGKSHQVGNLKMQPKKKRILQDESLKL